MNQLGSLTIDENVAEMTIAQPQNIADDAACRNASGVRKTLLVPDGVKKGDETGY